MSERKEIAEQDINLLTHCGTRIYFNLDSDKYKLEDLLNSQTCFPKGYARVDLRASVDSFDGIISYVYDGKRSVFVAKSLIRGESVASGKSKPKGKAGGGDAGGGDAGGGDAGGGDAGGGDAADQKTLT